MFRSRMTEHQIQEPIEKTDGLGFAFDDYDESRAVLMYITTPTYSIYNQNEFYTSLVDAVALCQESLEPGTIVDGEYKVVSCVPYGGVEYVIELKRIGADNA